MIESEYIMSKMIDQHKPYTHALQGIAGMSYGLLSAMKNKRIHQTIAASAMLMAVGAVGVSQANADDSNSSDSGNSESPCGDDSECANSENVDSEDAVDRSTGEASRDEDGCEDNGGAETGLKELEPDGGPTGIHPVSWETGEKWETETDLVVRLPGADYRFTRQYTSDLSKVDNPYDTGDTLPACADSTKISANIGSGWGWSNLRAATAEITWEHIPGQTSWQAGGSIERADITLYRPARKPKYVSGFPTSGEISISGPGNQSAGGDFDIEQDGFSGVEPTACQGLPAAVRYGEPGRWSQSFEMADGVGWITEDIDENGNYRTYVDTVADTKDLPDEILFNGSSTTWNDTDMVDAWIKIKWDGNRVVRADVYRPSASGGIITQTVQYYHLVNDSGLKIKYHNGTSYTTLNTPGTGTAVAPNADLGTEGDLVMVVRSTSNDPENASTDWRRQITQYRYHNGDAAPTTGDIRLRIEGADHQLKSVFRPQQVEHMTQVISTSVSPTDTTSVDAAIGILARADDAAFDGSSSADVYEVANKIVTFDSVTDRVEWQFVQSGSCGCGSGGATNGVVYNYEWLDGWSRSYGGETVDGTSLHMREYGLNGFSDWPTTVYRSHLTDIMYLDPGTNEQPFVWAQVLVDGDVPTGTTSDAWVSTRQYDASTQSLNGTKSPSSNVSYKPAIGNGAPEILSSATKGLVTQYSYDGENAGAVKRGVDGSTETILKRTFVDDSVSSRRRLVAKIELPRELGLAGAMPTNPLDIETTEFSYGYENISYSKLDWKRTRQEREIEDENGPSGAAQWAESWEFYDDKGQLIVTLDPDGVATRYEYDAWTGTLVKITRNYDPTAVGSISEIRLPTGTGSEPSNPFTGLSANTTGTLVTEYERDLHGRVTKAIRPGGVESWTVRGLDEDAERSGILYYSLLSMPHQVVSPGDYAGPASKRLMDAASKAIRSENWDVEDQASYDPGVDTYAGNNSIMDTTELARSVTNHDSSGQMTSTERWWDIANDYSATTSYEYDSYGRTSKVTDAEGTINLSEFDVLDRRIKSKTGTMVSNAVTIAEYFFDGVPHAATPAQGVGNGNITAVKLYDGVNTRITRMYYDDRDRSIATVSPDSPMSLTRYDNLDRPIESAVFPVQAGIPTLVNVKAAANPDPLVSLIIEVNPTGIVGNRSWYSKTDYSQRGYVWRQQTAIDATDGDTEYLSSYSWFDIEGNTLASWGPNSPMAIQEYDEHDRVSKTYVSDRLDEVTNGLDFASATSVIGDTILEQDEYTYDYANGGVMEMMKSRMRAHNETSTGALDDSTSVTSYVGMVYDDAQRRVATVNFGTNKADFSKGTSTTPTLWDFDTLAELREATDVLFSWNTFNARGLTEDVYSIQSGTGVSDLITTRYIYDDLSRTAASIENNENVSLSWDNTKGRYVVTGLDFAEQAEDRVTSFVYDKTNKVIKRVAHVPADPTGEDVQVTEYVYGVTAGSSSNPMDSLVASNNLLSEVRYPDEGTGEAGTTSAYKVKYAFNQLGELRGVTDQNQTIRTFERDLQGRVIADIVETPGTYQVNGVSRDVDDAIRRIGYEYDSLGRMTGSTSHISTASSGNIRDEAVFAYTPLWQVASVSQQHDGAVTGSSPKVEYTYSNVDANGAADNYSRLTKQVYPTGSDTIQYDYDTGEIDDRLSRVNHIDVYGQNGASYADLVKYDRIGMGMMAKTSIDLVSASHDVVLDRTKNHNGTSTAGAYPALDRFGRVTSHMWVRSDFGPHSPPTSHGNQPAFMEVTHTYDRASNRLTYNDDREGSTFTDRDRAFTYDRLHRLTEELRTPVLGSVYSHTSSQWDLDMLGNWTSKTDDADHDGDFADNQGVNFQDDREHNQANEIESGLQYDQRLYTSGTTPTFYDHRYDDNGNMTDERKGEILSADGVLMDGQVHTYDAWNRLVKTEFVTSSSTTTISENTYNALGWRTSKVFDTSTGAYDGVDQKRVYSYGADWRMIEEHIDTDVTTNSDSQGDADDDIDWISQQFWGIRYIDDAVGKRVDRDADGQWDDAECTNWYQLTDSQFSVGVVINDEGEISERIDYNAYGVARYHPAGDLKPDGFLDFFDIAMFEPGSIGDDEYNVEFDLNLDGEVDLADVMYFLAYNPTVTDPVISPIPSSWISDPRSTTGPDNSIGYAGYVFNNEREDYLVRNRVYDPVLGRWKTRDPIGYVDGNNLYEYVSGGPLVYVDVSGKGKGNVFDPHDTKGVYFEFTLECTNSEGISIEITRTGYAKDTYKLMKKLGEMTEGSCRIKDFHLSAHHSKDMKIVWGTGGGACTDEEFAKFLHLTDGATVNLEMCNSCDLAKQIIQHNPGVNGIEIKCTDGTNTNNPGHDWDLWTITRGTDCVVTSDDEPENE